MATGAEAMVVPGLRCQIPMTSYPAERVRQGATATRPGARSVRYFAYASESGESAEAATARIRQ